MPRGLFQKPTLYDLFFLSLEALWARGEHSARGELEQRQQASCDRSPKVEIQREDTRCPGLSTPFSRLALPPESSPGLEPPTIAPVVARLAASGGDFTESVSRVYKRTRNTHPSRCTAVARLTCERATGDADRRLWGVSRRLSSSSPRTGGPLVERERRGGARENGGEVLGAFARDEREDVVRARVAVGEATCAENQILQRVSRLSLSLSLSLSGNQCPKKEASQRERERRPKIRAQIPPKRPPREGRANISPSSHHGGAEQERRGPYVSRAAVGMGQKAIPEHVANPRVKFRHSTLDGWWRRRVGARARRVLRVARRARVPPPRSRREPTQPTRPPP